MFASAVRSASRAVSRPLRQAIPMQSRFSSGSAPASKESTPAPSESESSKQVYLTPERKRKLISLYHKAEKFVTHQNLDAYIDREFTPRMRQDLSDPKLRDYKRRTDGKVGLIFELAERRARPKMAGIAAMEGEEFSFGRMRSKSFDRPRKTDEARNLRLKAALYGVDDSLKAGLEMVEEYQRSGSVDLSDRSK